MKIKWLIPALSLLVILESVLIVNRLSGETTTFDQKIPGFPTRVGEQKPVSLGFQGDYQAEVGEQSQLKLVMTVNKNIALDGLDVYLKYDPESVEIIGIGPGGDFSHVARNWIEPENERIILSLVEPEVPEGVKFDTGNEATLAIVEFKALRAGNINFEYYDSDEGQGTVIAGQGRQLDFEKENFVLKIN